MGCFQRVSGASYVLHVQWVRSGACMCQTCLRAGAGWCEVFTVYCMLVPLLFYMHANKPFGGQGQSLCAL
jgi:hypothetical protein